MNSGAEPVPVFLWARLPWGVWSIARSPLGRSPFDNRIMDEYNEGNQPRLPRHSEAFVEKPDYILLDHTADLAVKVKGTDPVDLFENAAKSLLHLLLGDMPPEGGTPVHIGLSGEDLEDLMVQWLGEILYLLHGENLVVTRVIVDVVTSSRLEASLQAIPYDPEHHEILTEIKAITYHQIEVLKRGSHWEAKVIMDV